MKYRTNTGCLYELRVYEPFVMPLAELLNDRFGQFLQLHADAVARFALLRERDDGAHRALALKLKLPRFGMRLHFEVERRAAHRRFGKHEAHATLAEIDNLRLRGAL